MTDQQRKLSPDEVCDCYFADAKTWWGVALGCKSAPILGIPFVIWNVAPGRASIVAVLLSVIGEFCSWRSEQIKGTAESLRRKLDLHNAFGWEITESEMSDRLVEMPFLRRRAFLAMEAADPYFARTETPGPRQALENVKESARWSKHLARTMGQICLAATAIIVGICIVALLVSAQAIRNPNVFAKVGGFVTATLLALLSVGTGRLALNYYTFRDRAAEVQRQAEDLLKSTTPDELISAVKLWHEYHLARAAGSFIPSWLWKLKRDRLNSTSY